MPFLTAEGWKEGLLIPCFPDIIGFFLAGKVK